MVKDRWNEMNEKSAYKDWEYRFVQEHEFMTLYNQERVLEDLERFTEIGNLIRDLRRNILDIEVHLFSEGFAKARTKIRENGNLCFRIYSAVRAMQTELDNRRDQDDLVSRVRSVQFEGVKQAYIRTYWKYDGVVRRFEDTVRRGDILTSNEALDVAVPSDTLLPQTRPALQRSTSQSLEQARNIVNSLEERHQELLALERSLTEMRDLFVLFSTLVMEHGSILNLVEGNVQLASKHVVSATKELQTAREYQWKTRARGCLCFNQMTFMVIILVVLCVIACLLIVKKIVF
ncbi:hypothetical protein quinque_015141 [Culex quinquefasciatus]